MLPRDRRAAPTMGEALDIDGQSTKIVAPEGATAIDATLAELSERSADAITAG